MPSGFLQICEKIPKIFDPYPPKKYFFNLTTSHNFWPVSWMAEGYVKILNNVWRHMYFFRILFHFIYFYDVINNRQDGEEVMYVCLKSGRSGYFHHQVPNLLQKARPFYKILTIDFGYVKNGIAFWLIRYFKIEDVLNIRCQLHYFISSCFVWKCFWGFSVQVICACIFGERKFYKNAFCMKMFLKLFCVNNLCLQFFVERNQQKTAH